MKCAMCGCDFNQDEAKSTCEGCPIGGACGMIKCPNCNYEMPVEPKLIKVLRTWKENLNGNRGKSRRGTGNSVDSD